MYTYIRDQRQLSIGTENSNKCLLTSVFKLYCPVIKNYSAYIRCEEYSRHSSLIFC